MDNACTEDYVVEEPQVDDGVRLIQGEISAGEIGNLQKEQPVTATVLQEELNAIPTAAAPKKRAPRKRKQPIEPLPIPTAEEGPYVLQAPAVHPSVLPPPPPPPGYRPVFGGTVNKRLKMMKIHRFLKTSFHDYLVGLGFRFELAHLQSLSEEELDYQLEEMKFAIATKPRAAITTDKIFFQMVKGLEGFCGMGGLGALLQNDQEFLEILEELSVEYSNYCILGVEERFVLTLVTYAIPIYTLNKQLTMLQNEITQQCCPDTPAATPADTTTTEQPDTLADS